MNSHLRKSLEQLAKFDAVKQLAQLDLLKRKLGHSVFAITDAKSNLSYNCVMYAMNVHEHAGLYQLLVHLTYGPDKKLDVSMDTNFLQMLIDDGDLHLVNPELNNLAIGLFTNYVMYYPFGLNLPTFVFSLRRTVDGMQRIFDDHIRNTRFEYVTE
jgi:hypothetical protein